MTKATPAWVSSLSKSVEALIGTPQSNNSAQVTQYQPNSYVGVQPALAQALGRSMDSFGSQMGPGYPLIPLPIDPLGPNGRPDPRKYQYDISENLVVSKRLPLWNTLRAAAEQCDLVARCVTIIQREIAQLDWSLTVSNDAINRIMADSDVGHAEASALARKQNKDQISSLQEFWENPYPQNDRGWREWITEAIYQILVYDGLAIYPKMNLGRKVVGFLIIDAPTIKILLDNYGDLPRPPDVAYQQVVWGFPRGEFVASPDSDVSGAFYAGEYGITERDQLSYFVQNRRSHTPYGWSAVEQSLDDINLYLERQKWLLSEYKHGTSAEVYIKTVGDDLTLATLRGYETVYNDYLEGSTAQRHRTKLLPEGFDPIFAPNIDERYKADYDEHLIKKIAGMFGVSPMQLGVVPRTGMSSGKGAQEGESDNAETVSLVPTMRYVEEFVNSLGRRYLGQTKDITFVLNDNSGGKDALTDAQAEHIFVTSGIRTVNEVRAEQGYPLLDFAEADQPFIVAGTAVTFLKGQLEMDGIPNGTTPGTNNEGKENAHQVGATENSLTPPVPTPPEPSETNETNEESKTNEAKAYRKFISKPRARQFVFKHHTPEEAETLKAVMAGDNPKVMMKRKVSELPGYALRRALEDKHAQSILKALGDIAGIDAAITQAMSQASATADVTAAVSTALQSVIANPVALEAALKTLYDESYDTATAEASKMLGGDKMRIPLVKMGQRLQSLVNSAQKTSTDIHATTLGRIRTALVDGMQNGDTHSEISDAVNSVIDDPTRASYIAITETNSSYNAGFVDQLQAAGETTWDWLAYDDACDECMDQESENPHGLMDPVPCDGSHPNCRCTVVMSGL